MLTGCNPDESGATPLAEMTLWTNSKSPDCNSGDVSAILTNVLNALMVSIATYLICTQEMPVQFLARGLNVTEAEESRHLAVN